MDPTATHPPSNSEKPLNVMAAGINEPDEIEGALERWWDHGDDNPPRLPDHPPPGRRLTPLQILAANEMTGYELVMGHTKNEPGEIEDTLARWRDDEDVVDEARKRQKEIAPHIDQLEKMVAEAAQHQNIDRMSGLVSNDLDSHFPGLSTTLLENSHVMELFSKRQVDTLKAAFWVKGQYQPLIRPASSGGGKRSKRRKSLKSKPVRRKSLKSRSIRRKSRKSKSVRRKSLKSRSTRRKSSKLPKYKSNKSRRSR